jgi:hypothetical protein
MRHKKKTPLSSTTTSISVFVLMREHVFKLFEILDFSEFTHITIYCLVVRILNKHLSKRRIEGSETSSKRKQKEINNNSILIAIDILFRFRNVPIQSIIR